MHRVHGDGDQLVHFGYYNHLGALRFYQARLDEAVQLAQRARRLIDILGALAWQSATYDHIELHRLLASGSYDALYQYAERRLPSIESDPSLSSFVTSIYHLLARAYWHEGRFDDLRRMVQKIPEPVGEWVFMNERRTYLLAHALQALAEQRYRAGVELLIQAVTLQEQIRSVVTSSHPRLDLACLYWQWHQTSGEAQHLDQALQHLNTLLAELAERGMPGILLQSGRMAIPLLRHALPHSEHASLIERALAVFGEEVEFRPIPIPDSGESLTPREVEVLHLLMTGATNREIAEQLVVTTRTAKAHVSNILRKLDVSSRTQAVARARELALV